MGTSVCWRAAGGHSYVCSKSHCVAVRRILKKWAQTSASVHQLDILSFGRVLQCAAVCCSVARPSSTSSNICQQAAGIGLQRPTGCHKF